MFLYGPQHAPHPCIQSAHQGFSATSTLLPAQNHAASCTLVEEACQACGQFSLQICAQT